MRPGWRTARTQCHARASCRSASRPSTGSVEDVVDLSRRCLDGEGFLPGPGCRTPPPPGEGSQTSVKNWPFQINSIRGLLAPAVVTGAAPARTRSRGRAWGEGGSGFVKRERVTATRRRKTGIPGIIRSTTLVQLGLSGLLEAVPPARFFVLILVLKIAVQTTIFGPRVSRECACVRCVRHKNRERRRAVTRNPPENTEGRR
jgi:hypothetical protein